MQLNVPQSAGRLPGAQAIQPRMLVAARLRDPRPRVALSFGSWMFEVQIDEVLAKVQRVSKTMPEARWRGSVE